MCLLKEGLTRVLLMPDRHHRDIILCTRIYRSRGRITATHRLLMMRITTRRLRGIALRGRFGAESVESGIDDTVYEGREYERTDAYETQVDLEGTVVRERSV